MHPRVLKRAVLPLKLARETGNLDPRIPGDVKTNPWRWGFYAFSLFIMQPALCLFSPRPEGSETSIMSYQTTLFGNVKSSQAWLFSTLLRAKCTFTYQQESLSSFLPSHQFMRGVGLAFLLLFSAAKRDARWLRQANRVWEASICLGHGSFL